MNFLVGYQPPKENGLSFTEVIEPYLPRIDEAPVPGILQARTLEWVAISFSNA